MGLAAAATFVVSTIQFPIWGLPVPVHLGLFGLLGIVLGKRAFPVLYVCLFFQSILLQHGGLLSLGVNALNMGLGTFAGWRIWQDLRFSRSMRAVLAGFLGALLPAVLLVWEFNLVGYWEFSLAGYQPVLLGVISLYGSVAVVEATVTPLAVSFLYRVKPEIFFAAAG